MCPPDLSSLKWDNDGDLSPNDILTLVEKLTKAEQENKETSDIKLNSSAIYHKETSWSKSFGTWTTLLETESFSGWNFLEGCLYTAWRLANGMSGKTRMVREEKTTKIIPPKAQILRPLAISPSLKNIPHARSVRREKSTFKKNYRKENSANYIHNRMYWAKMKVPK